MHWSVRTVWCIGATGTEVTALYDIAVVAKDTLTSHFGGLPPDVLEKVRIGLRARFDL
jgi:hypothetical protein